MTIVTTKLEEENFLIGKFFTYFQIMIYHFIYKGTVVRRFSVKKVFLKTSPNSGENICAKVSFLISLQASGLQLYLKKRF